MFQDDELQPKAVKGYFTVAFPAPGKFRKFNEWLEPKWLSPPGSAARTGQQPALDLSRLP